jgi:hypothetical protein
LAIIRKSSYKGIDQIGGGAVGESWRADEKKEGRCYISHELYVPFVASTGLVWPLLGDHDFQSQS